MIYCPRCESTGGLFFNAECGIRNSEFIVSPTNGDDNITPSPTTNVFINPQLFTSFMNNLLTNCAKIYYNNTKDYYER